MTTAPQQPSFGFNQAQTQDLLKRTIDQIADYTEALIGYAHTVDRFGHVVDKADEDYINNITRLLDRIDELRSESMHMINDSLIDLRKKISYQKRF